MFAIILAVAIIALPFLFFHKRFQEYQKYRRAVNSLPGPPTVPFLGNAPVFGKDPHTIFTQMIDWWREYGKNRYRVWVGMDANAFVTDPKDVEVVLSSTQILKKSIIYDLLHPWLGQGLLTSKGALWHSHRKMITPSFHFKILVDFLEVMNQTSTKFVQSLTAESTNERIFDFQRLVCYCTLDVICETAMGVSVNAMDDNDSDVVRAFQYMCFSVQMRAFSPWKRTPFLFQFAPEYKQYMNALNTLKNFTFDIISKRREAMQNNAKVAKNADTSDDKMVRPKNAFLDTLLTATIDGRPLTTQEIYEEVSTFMFEGHDTTASGISFAVYLLSRHQDVQEKVFQEQKDIFNGDLSRQPSYADVQEMKYLGMVIKEAQRLYPSVPMIGRYTEKPFDLNGTILEKNTTINIFIAAMGYNEKYFPDPYKFDPERFSPENRANSNPYEYVPFSAGPRNCIGQKFAQIEMKSVVAKIVRSFKILPPEDGLESLDGYEPIKPRNKYDPVLSAVLTLKSDNGVQIRLRKREV